jgi:hypothetical protein
LHAGYLEVDDIDADAGDAQRQQRHRRIRYFARSIDDDEGRRVSNSFELCPMADKRFLFLFLFFARQFTDVTQYATAARLVVRCDSATQIFCQTIRKNTDSDYLARQFAISPPPPDDEYNDDRMSSNFKYIRTKIHKSTHVGASETRCAQQIDVCTNQEVAIRSRTANKTKKKKKKKKRYQTMAMRCPTQSSRMALNSIS